MKRLSLLLILLAAVSGCGGGGGKGVQDATPGRGSVRMTINWPTSTTREIPEATRSIAFEAVTLIKEDGEEELTEDVVVKEHVEPRPEGQPTSEVVLSDLPSVTIRIKATAHASSDGSGESLAEGHVDVNVPESGTVTAKIVLGSDTCPPPMRLYAKGVQPGTKVGDKYVAEYSSDGFEAYAELGADAILYAEHSTGGSGTHAGFDELISFTMEGMEGQPVEGVEAVFATEFSAPEHYQWWVSGPWAFNAVDIEGAAGTGGTFGMAEPPTTLALPVIANYSTPGQEPSWATASVEIYVQRRITSSPSDNGPISFRLTFLGFRGLPEGAKVVGRSHCLKWTDKRAPEQ